MGKLNLLQGTLDLLVLKILTRRPMHGYAIARELELLSGDALSVDEGSLYPCLYRMEKRAWLTSETAESENRRRARFYSLTAEGLYQLGEEERNWSDFSRTVAQVLHRANRQD